MSGFRSGARGAAFFERARMRRQSPAIVGGAAEEFARKPERPDTESCGRHLEAHRVACEKPCGGGVLVLQAHPQKNFIKRRLGLQFVVAYPRLCSTAPLTPI